MKSFKEWNPSSQEMDKNIFERAFYYDKPNQRINATFDTLILTKCKNNFEWYKDLYIDKGNASKIRRGLVVPPIHIMIMIAKYFHVDTCVIWGNLPLEDYFKIINSARYSKK